MRQTHFEDQAWAATLRGENYSQIARTVLDPQGVPVYANATSVRRAVERAHRRHEVVSDSKVHRTKQDSILNDLLLRSYQELQDAGQSHLAEAVLVAERLPDREAARAMSEAMSFETDRHNRVIRLIGEIRKLVEAQSKLWGTSVTTHHHQLSVIESAPHPLSQATGEERRELLKIIAAEAERRASQPIAIEATVADDA